MALSPPLAILRAFMAKTQTLARDENGDWISFVTNNAPTIPSFEENKTLTDREGLYQSARSNMTMFMHLKDAVDQDIMQNKDARDIVANMSETWSVNARFFPDEDPNSALSKRVVTTNGNPSKQKTKQQTAPITKPKKSKPAPSAKPKTSKPKKSKPAPSAKPKTSKPKKSKPAPRRIVTKDGKPSKRKPKKSKPAPSAKPKTSKPAPRRIVTKDGKPSKRKPRQNSKTQKPSKQSRVDPLAMLSMLDEFA